jgi:hypothetical protein
LFKVRFLDGEMIRDRERWLCSGLACLSLQRFLEIWQRGLCGDGSLMQVPLFGACVDFMPRFLGVVCGNFDWAHRLLKLNNRSGSSSDWFSKLRLNRWLRFHLASIMEWHFYNQRNQGIQLTLQDTEEGKVIDGILWLRSSRILGTLWRG